MSYDELSRNAGSKRLPQSIDVVTSPRHHRWVEAAGADQRALMRSDAVEVWILRSDAYATYAGAGAAPVA